MAYQCYTEKIKINWKSYHIKDVFPRVITEKSWSIYISHNLEKKNRSNVSPYTKGYQNQTLFQIKIQIWGKESNWILSHKIYSILSFLDES